VRLAGAFVDAGVRSIRLTGGEPLTHPTLVEIVARLAALDPRPALSLTTNGIGLAGRAEALAAAGLDRVNVSVDTLDPARFATLTRRNRLKDVLAGVGAAADAGLAPVKVNAVLVRGSNLEEGPDLLAWALAHGYQMRFIEHMPLDADHTWTREEMVTADEILAVLGTRFDLRPVGHIGNAPAEEFEVFSLTGERLGTAGVIASVTRPFCRDCDRLRLTADGQLRTCLFAQGETDLRGPLRAGASNAELIGIIATAVAGKQAGHGINVAGFVQPDRTMSAIGG
jgi:cyclic pyranopterin phosphate synthase